MHSIEEIETQIGQTGLVAAIRCRAPLDVLIEVGDALHAAPLTAVMVSSRSAQPWQIVTEMRRRYGNSMAIGVGPLRGRGEVGSALAAGAQFVMSLDCDWTSGTMCRSEGVLWIPCIQEAAQLRATLAAGWRVVSLFPAVRCGPQSLAHLTHNFPTAHILAAGGVHTANLPNFAQAGAAAVIVRGVLGAETRWRMNAVILHMRRLRAAWDAATISRK